MESQTTAHHCSSLISLCSVPSPFYRSLLSHLWLGDPQAQWTWLGPVRAKAPASLAFLIQHQLLRAEAGLRPEVDATTDQDLQKHLVPPLGLHIGKLNSREGKGLSQNHITIIRVRSSDSLSFMLFLWSFLNPFHPSGWNHVVRLAVPALLSMYLPISLEQNLIPWQEYFLERKLWGLMCWAFMLCVSILFWLCIS